MDKGGGSGFLRPDRERDAGTDDGDRTGSAGERGGGDRDRGDRSGGFLELPDRDSNRDADRDTGGDGGGSGKFFD